MAEETTLLAHLVPRMTSRIEDTATDSLAFILNKSEDCRDAFNRLLRDEGFNPGPMVRFQTQVTYEDGSRPDMNGYDKSGAKRLLVESKFWASLLQGQGSGYLDQLDEEGPGVLLFIAPESRLVTLWGEIERQMVEAGKQLHTIGVHENVRRSQIADSDKALMLVSWTFLLRHMADAVPTDSQAASDIAQLHGLVRRQGDDEFLPIRADELAPALPRRIQWLNQLVDDVVELGTIEGWINTERLNKTPQRTGYGRYFRLIDVPGAPFLGINYDLWAMSADTPLWLWVGHELPANAEELRTRVPSPEEYAGFGYFDLPIYLKPGVEYSTVLKCAAKQLKDIADALRNHL